MLSQAIGRNGVEGPTGRVRDLLAGAVIGLAILTSLPARAEEPAPPSQPQSGFVHGVKDAGRAVGIAFHDIGQGAKRVGLEIGHGAAKAGREIGQAAKEGGKAFARAIRGEGKREE